MREKIEVREYSEEEFESLNEKREERSKYDEVWKELEEKLKNKSVNSKYLKEEFLKECKKRDIVVSKFVDSVLYSKMMRMIKNKKVVKKYDENIVVYKFV